MLSFACLGFCSLPFATSWHIHLSGFPSSASPRLLLAQLPWQLLLSPELFHFSSCPFPSVTAPNCSTPGIPAWGQAGIPYPAQGTLQPCTRCQSSAGPHQTFGVPELPDHCQGRAGSWEPVLRAGTEACGDWKIIPGCWIHVGAGEPRHPVPAH